MIAETLLAVATLAIGWYIVSLVKRWLSDDPETRTVDTEFTLKHTFTRAHTLVTYPNGDTEKIIYDNFAENSDNRIVTELFEEKCFTVDRDWGINNRPTLEGPNVPTENTRMFSLANVRDMDTEWTEDLVAVAQVEVTKHQKSNGNRWRTTKYEWDWKDDYDVEIWVESEWEAHND